ncbi:MAG: hypothetical protein LC792_05610, partial [Actinobacteria bacterium]|nr:hypothetical protein [Actinomycetota bacterium]
PALACGLALAVVVAGCTGGGGAGGRAGGRGARHPLYNGPRVGVTGAQPLGFKWDWPRVDRYAPFLSQSAGGATFYELVWCDVEPRRGQRDWSRVDEVARSAEALGYSLFLKLRVGSCWATDGRGGHERGARRKTASSLPADLGAYEEFVRAAVSRYSARGVREYAVENEVNAPIMWDGTPQDYERLAVAAARAVRAASPGARVLDGGISSTGYGAAIADRLLGQRRPDQAVAAYRRWYARRFGVRSETFPDVADAGQLRAVVGAGQARRDLDFLAATVRLAQQRVFDGWQAHFYERWDNADVLLGYLRDTLPPGFPVEAWEVGLFLPDGGDERAQASEAAKLVARLLGGGASRVIWLPLAYNPEGRHDTEVRSGLLDPEGRVRASGRLLGDLAQAARGATWRALARPGVAGLAFDRPGHSEVVVWSDQGATLAVPAPPGAEARDLDGRPLPWGLAGLALGPQPVELRGPPALGAAVR